MPNKTIYLNTIKEMEESAGFSFINGDEVAQKLQEVWKKDKTQAKLDYLAAYREVFRDVLKKWSDNELSLAFNARSETMPNFKKCLLKTDESLKLCAMALIPELRENEDVLSHMTFGVIDSTKLEDEFVSVRKKYLQVRTSESAMKKRKADAYDKHKTRFLQTPIRKITELVRDKDALKQMSQDEKIDYALALNVYRNTENLNRPLDSQEKDLIDDALRVWQQELGCTNGETLDEFVGNQYFQYAQKIGKPEWIENQVNEAIAEYNKEPNPAKQEIERYKKIETQTAEPQEEDERVINRLLKEDPVEIGEVFIQRNLAKEVARRKQREKEENEKRLAEEKEIRRAKERANPTAEITDDVAETVGDFFKQEELEQEIKETKETPNRKERVFLQEKVAKFNQEYSLKINHDKLRTSVEQLSALMIKAREEKQRFLDENSVVVIENGKETCYTAKDYYKDKIVEANQACFDEINKIEQERLRAEQEYKKFLKKIELQDKNVEDREILEQLKADNEKEFKEKIAGFNNAIKKARANLNDSLSSLKGGIVVEKNGDTVKQHKASRYYETHETQKEQNVYSEYQQMYSRVYKDACKNIKEKNYPEGKVTDFSHVAKDVDQLFKSAMYLSNVYDNDKNKEIVQKCSFGGLSAEQLASFATYIDGDNWTKDQYREDVWQKQSQKARKILAGWEQNAKNNKKVKPSVRIKETIEKSLKSFNKSEITKKQLLDYMLAGEAYLQKTYPLNINKLFNAIQYNRVNNVLKRCRSALGLTGNSSLRVEMNIQYTKLASSMSKEEIFKSVETRMGYSLSFNAEKIGFEKEHQIVQDRELARKMGELESLKALDKEPMSIPELDERNAILHHKPRVEPIVPAAQVQPMLQTNK